MRPSSASSAAIAPDRVLNWPEVIQAGLAALRHAAADVGDAEAIALLRRAEAHAQDLPGTPDVLAGSFPVICPVFELDGQFVRTISTVMRFDTAIEVTTSRLRIEPMFPADQPADAYFRPVRRGQRAWPGRGLRWCCS